MRLISVIILSLLLISCNKPDPNPELKDPIYSDLNASLAATNAALESEKKTLEGHELTLKDVIPQSGQIKFAQKRVFESQAKIQKLQQESKYLELKIAARLKEAKKSYSVAFAKKEPWPDPNEFSSYETQKKLRAAKRDWDSRTRVKDFSSGGGEKKSPEGSSGGH